MQTQDRSITLANRRIPLVVFVKYLTLAMYIAGAIGLSVPASRPLFQALTPFNLLFTAFLLVAFQPDRARAFWIFALIAAILGYGAEVLGVHTGFPFGDYSYGKTLGLKVWEVPLTIALNWLVLAYCGGYLAAQLTRLPKVIRVSLAATIMVALDVIIEPVAIRYDFWSWAEGSPPIENYIGWFGVAWIIQWSFTLLPFRKDHPLARHFFFIQATFFTLCLVLAKVI